MSSQHTYHEQDIPPNQIAHNLENLLGQSVKVRDKGFEEIIKVEKDIAVYKKRLGEWLGAMEIKAPDLDEGAVAKLQLLETSYQRKMLWGGCDRAERNLKRIEFCKQYLLEIYDAYDTLLFSDPRASTEKARLLVNSTKPVVLSKILQELRGVGLEKDSGISYLENQSDQLSSPVYQMLKAPEGKKIISTALVKISNENLENYAENYNRVRQLYFVADFRLKQAEEDLQRVSRTLDEWGGKLNVAEQYELDTFIIGNNINFSQGKHLADLDAIRYTLYNKLRGRS